MKQFATFYVNEKLYGVDVIKVQEVTRKLKLTPVRRAPPFVRGLMNLRGQISTAIGLRSLIDPEVPTLSSEDEMTVVCRGEDGLLSLLVDRIGDVVEVGDEAFEPVPDNLEGAVKSLLSGIYKMESNLLSIIEIEKLTEVLKQ